jgi:hypothetical protein
VRFVEALDARQRIEEEVGLDLRLQQLQPRLRHLLVDLDAREPCLVEPALRIAFASGEVEDRGQQPALHEHPEEVSDRVLPEGPGNPDQRQPATAQAQSHQREQQRSHHHGQRESRDSSPVRRARRPELRAHDQEEHRQRRDEEDRRVVERRVDPVPCRDEHGVGVVDDVVHEAEEGDHAEARRRDALHPCRASRRVSGSMTRPAHRGPSESGA